MSDGNFNRSLLPKSELSSGIRAGKAQMRAKAMEALQAMMADSALTIVSDADKARLTEEFCQALRKG